MKLQGSTWLRCLLAAAFAVLAASAHGQVTVLTNAFITQLISREYSVDIGGVQTPDIQQLTSREFSLFINNGPADPYSQVTSREYSLVEVGTNPPPVVAGLVVSNSPTGSQVLLNWSNYNQWAVGTVARFEIFLSYQSFTSVAGMTPYATVPAESVSTVLSNLPAFQTYFVAVVAVDALGNYIATVYYSGVYPISPQVVSREYSLAIGNDTPQPQYLQLSSREYSLVVDQAAPPPAITNLAVTGNATGSSVLLNWSGYNQWAFGDIAQYAVYYSSQPITSVAGLTPYATVAGETFSLTVNGLTPFQTYYFAVVPVDAAGNYTANVVYAGNYPLSPQVISREYSLAIDNGPALAESRITSREYSLLVAGTNTAAPVTGIGSGFTAKTSVSAYDAIDLSWTNYNELAQQDVVGYEVFAATSFFQNITNLTPLAYVPAGIQSCTLGKLFSSITYFVAVVAVDASGNYNPNVYAVSAQPSGPDINFNSEPQSQTNSYGANVTFSVAVSGEGPFGYQWQFNGNALPGQNAATLVLNHIVYTNAGAYSVLVTNAYGGVGSGVAQLTVTPPVNAPPELPNIPALTVDALVLLTVTNTAAESDPNATVTYSLLNAPAGMTVDGGGIITWTPTLQESAGTNLIRTVATSTDSLATNTVLSATNSFTVIVRPVPVVLTGPNWLAGEGFQFSLSNTIVGVTYTIDASTNLVNWVPVITFDGFGGPITIVDPNADLYGCRFYRVKHVP